MATALPTELMLNVLSNVTVHDITSALEAFPALRSHTLLITDHTELNPKFFKRLEGIERAYIFPDTEYLFEYFPVSPDLFYDPQKHDKKYLIKLVELNSHVHSEINGQGIMRHTLLSYDHEKPRDRGFVDPQSQQQGIGYSVPMLAFDKFTYGFWDEEAYEVPVYESPLSYQIEERMDEMTECNWHTGLSIHHENWLWGLTLTKDIGMNAGVDLSCLLSLNIEGIACVSGLTLPFLKKLSVSLVHTDSDHNVLSNINISSTRKLVIHCKSSLPSITNIHTEPSDSLATRLFELYSVIGPRFSEENDVDLTLLKDFNVALFNGVSSYVLTRCDLTNLEVLKLTLTVPEPEQRHEAYDMPNLKVLNIQVRAPDVVLPGFSAPQLYKLEFGLMRERVDLSIFTTHADFTPEGVTIYRSTKLLDNPKTARFQLDVGQWRPIMQNVTSLTLIGFDMPFLFDRDYMDLDDSESLWIWRVKLFEQNVLLRPVIGHSDAAGYNRTFLETGVLSLTFPHRYYVSTIIPKGYESNFSFFPIVMNESQCKVKHLDIITPCFASPKRLKLTVSTVFDEFTLNGQILPPYWKIPSLREPVMDRNLIHHCEICDPASPLTDLTYDVFSWDFHSNDFVSYNELMREFSKDELDRAERGEKVAYRAYPGFLDYLLGTMLPEHPYPYRDAPGRTYRGNKRRVFDLRDVRR